jgi:uncharacterized membrane protein (UPF0127 family)
MIRNVTRDTVLAEHVVEAKSMFSRMRGMLGRRFDNFDSMLFKRNNSVHTWFMGIPIDVAFLDDEGVVMSLSQNLRPWRMTGCFSAKMTIELPAGVFERTGTVVGDRLDVIADSRI